MIDHVNLQVSDVEASRRFYEPLLVTLGVTVASDGEGWVGFFFEDDGGSFWLIPAERAGDRELHLAFRASDRAQVRDFHAAAIAIGAEILYSPQLFPEYHDAYFATFVRDPDGHNVEAVCHVAEL
ncbi:MAG: VOC family protein [Acidimicrobiales bacterium]|jgi:catechol 2,3-dioxygenase-like lactoylglutathione lyase family enzyme